MPHRPVVVVIEEQVELRSVIRDVLGDEGYDVLPAGDVAEALSILREKRVDLLVSDLPEAQPGEADPLSEVGRDFPDLPLIVLTEESKNGGPFFGPWRVQGTRVLLRKPFRLDDLIAASREVVG